MREFQVNLQAAAFDQSAKLKAVVATCRFNDLVQK